MPVILVLYLMGGPLGVRSALVRYREWSTSGLRKLHYGHIQDDGCHSTLCQPLAFSVMDRRLAMVAQCFVSSLYNSPGIVCPSSSRGFNFTLRFTINNELIVEIPSHELERYLRAPDTDGKPHEPL
jgi:hypothetical protein